MTCGVQKDLSLFCGKSSRVLFGINKTKTVGNMKIVNRSVFRLTQPFSDLYCFSEPVASARKRNTKYVSDPGNMVVVAGRNSYSEQKVRSHLAAHTTRNTLQKTKSIFERPSVLIRSMIHSRI